MRNPRKFIYFEVADFAIVGKMLLKIGRKVRDASPITLIRFSPRHEEAQFLGKQQETSYQATTTMYEPKPNPLNTFRLWAPKNATLKWRRNKGKGGAKLFQTKSVNWRSDSILPADQKKERKRKASVRPSLTLFRSNYWKRRGKRRRESSMLWNIR